MTKLARCTAEGGSSRQTSSSLALATRVPAPTVSKILQTLLQAGLLSSERGAQGGYRLARSATEITLCEIIHCLEGSIALTECSLDKNECEQQPFCSTSNHWKRINTAIRDALEGITLEDMATDEFTPVFVMKKAVPIQISGGIA